MKRLIAILAIASLALVGCNEKTETANQKDRRTVARAANGYVNNQPPPVANWSQIRQSLIEIERMQIEATATYTAFFQMGTNGPVFTCDSIGTPIPADTQLTNPESMATTYQSPYTLPQMETTGVFTSTATQATYVICTRANGDPYFVSWEGPVMSSTIPIRWDGNRMVPDEAAASTADITVGK
jgi:uncharacterized lipoprotein NlpE involved in copper resistance